MKTIAIDLKDIINSSDFGVIYLMKKSKFTLTFILDSLKKEKCPFTMEMNIWLDFTKSKDLRDGVSYIIQ